LLAPLFPVDLRFCPIWAVDFASCPIDVIIWAVCSYCGTQMKKTKQIVPPFAQLLPVPSLRVPFAARIFGAVLLFCH
jgi:hypothetical protein